MSILRRKSRYYQSAPVAADVLEERRLLSAYAPQTASDPTEYGSDGIVLSVRPFVVATDCDVRGPEVAPSPCDDSPPSVRKPILIIVEDVEGEEMEWDEGWWMLDFDGNWSAPRIDPVRDGSMETENPESPVGDTQPLTPPVGVSDLLDETVDLVFVDQLEYEDAVFEGQVESDELDFEHQVESEELVFEGQVESEDLVWDPDP